MKLRSNVDDGDDKQRFENVYEDGKIFFTRYTLQHYFQQTVRDFFSFCSILL